jgi:hypothetical protein
MSQKSNYMLLKKTDAQNGFRAEPFWTTHFFSPGVNPFALLPRAVFYIINVNKKSRLYIRQTADI